MGGGGWQVPPSQVSLPEQSASLQHWLAQTQLEPDFVYPEPQVKSQSPAAEQLLVPFAGATQAVQATDLKQPVCGVLPVQTPPQKC